MTTEQIRQLKYFIEQIEAMADNITAAIKQHNSEDAEYWTVQQEQAALALHRYLTSILDGEACKGPDAAKEVPF